MGVYQLTSEFIVHRFSCFLRYDDHEAVNTPEGYGAHMGCWGAFGGEMEVRVAAEVFHCQIVVHYSPLMRAPPQTYGEAAVGTAVHHLHFR